MVAMVGLVVTLGMVQSVEHSTDLTVNRIYLVQEEEVAQELDPEDQVSN